MRIVFTVCFLIIFSTSLFSTIEEKLYDPAYLIQEISRFQPDDLRDLSFFELNILKNVIFSAQGYQYAEDRTWLYDYFYNRKNTVGILDKPVLPHGGPANWNLSSFVFPKPSSTNQLVINDGFKKAVAVVRVSLYHKLKRLRSADELDQLIDKEFNLHFMNGRIFGRRFHVSDQYRDSIRREAHGYNQLLQILLSQDDFDSCQLLGVYLGSISLLKNCLEARKGKVFTGVEGWEIEQLLGKTPQNNAYSLQNMPADFQKKIRRIDEIIRKMVSSSLGDIPESLKNKKEIHINVQEEEYGYSEGC